MFFKKSIQILFFLLSITILFYSYYYLPSKNKGSIKIEKNELNNLKNIKTEVTKEEKFKNTFFNTQYKSQNDRGQIYTTEAKESYIFQNEPDLIYLIQPFSYTRLEKDQSMLEINAQKGLFDKNKKITSYENHVIIKNKNYLITSDQAKHFSSKNMIIISGNVIMKDLTNGLSHIAYCDIVEINTITNDAIAFMNTEKKKVITKKFR